MSLLRESSQGVWGSRWTFVAATAGAAVGMGNLWKFSALAGANGGAAFVVVYLFFMVLVSLPVLIAEVVIGSRGRANPITASQNLAREAAVSSWWQLMGWLGCLAGLCILSYYSVMAGLGIAHIDSIFTGQFKGLTAAKVGEAFNQLLADPWQLALWHSIFLALVVLVVSTGVERGMARMARIILPVFVLLLVIVVLYSNRMGDMAAAQQFLFSFQWQAITPEIVLAALGQAFFTLSIGLGAMMAFGAYMPDGRSVAGLLSAVVLIDTAVALLAGLAIFPLVFSLNIAPSTGPGLMFVALPYAFGHIEHGELFGGAFFTVVALVGLSSGVALMEPAVAWLVERCKFKRLFAALTVGLLAWGLGIVALLSLNEWSDVRWLDRSIFNWLDYISANILLPLGGLLIAIFVGWRMRLEVVRDEFYKHSGVVFVLWYWLLRYIAAPAVLLILLLPLYRWLVATA
ncbi:sodium-dependent transporter [Dasania sp. GY-MA-18]|uniref:Sodium-dependent transporter n=1 Tax=Dasania phycosphaerae TaxID=2950436 RepID=A0A9J6RHE7_9GAMM|nr:MULTISPECIES: sodium-dependent transporter [Dasania]MCR8921268.1 sodium-dependent transporter [Dasania sp. GY-MA-18]MCZ0863696.1 sodium-dependent transporter [Dasania phycosphaerae]MCZ0867424.1 sodium-dependent transporter [Dasania phycosphaerae]